MMIYQQFDANLCHETTWTKYLQSDQYSQTNIFAGPKFPWQASLKFKLDITIDSRVVEQLYPCSQPPLFLPSFVPIVCAHGRSTLQACQRAWWALFQLFPHITTNSTRVCLQWLITHTFTIGLTMGHRPWKLMFGWHATLSGKTLP